jgi:hypothetical protein
MSFFVVGDRCEVPLYKKDGTKIMRKGTVTKFTIPHPQFCNGLVEGVFDDGGKFSGNGSWIKKTKQSEMLPFYVTALFAEKIYYSNIFGDSCLSDIAFWDLTREWQTSAKASWEVTVARYPYLEIARKQVKNQITIPYLFTYWHLLDGIVWAIAGDLDYWQNIIKVYETEFLSKS